MAQSDRSQRLVPGARHRTRPRSPSSPQCPRPRPTPTPPLPAPRCPRRPEREGSYSAEDDTSQPHINAEIYTPTPAASAPPQPALLEPCACSSRRCPRGCRGRLTHQRRELEEQRVDQNHSTTPTRRAPPTYPAPPKTSTASDPQRGVGPHHQDVAARRDPRDQHRPTSHDTASLGPSSRCLGCLACSESGPDQPAHPHTAEPDVPTHGPSRPRKSSATDAEAEAAPIQQSRTVGAKPARTKTLSETDTETSTAPLQRRDVVEPKQPAVQ